MKRGLVFPTLFCVLAIVLTGWYFSHAQELGPVVDILGKPETAPPQARAYVSVVDPTTGRIVDGLSEDNFAVQVSEQDVPATVALEAKGVAVVLVIDRGGIARRGDPRIGDAVGLADSLLGMLTIDGSASADMVALIGVRGTEEGGLTPLVPFTDYDPNAVSNEFDKLRTEVVGEVTPLYDGIDQAIEWLTDNNRAEIQHKLAHRRPLIVVFSDGIDDKFSSESHEAIIASKCRENNILLYTVRMEARGRTTDVDNMEALARQTNGIYVTHSTNTHDQVLALFENVVTQRQAYQVAFPLYRAQGDYEVHIQVTGTPLGDGADETTVSSQLQLPVVALTAPPDGFVYTVPYSHTPRVEIPLSAAISFPDGITREPAAVRYYRNGVLIATSTTAPFAARWDATDYITQTEETRQTQEVKGEDFTFTAEIDDAYLAETAASAPVSGRVEWAPLPAYTRGVVLLRWLGNFWWLLLILAVLAVGLLVLLILLVRTRGELARRVVTRTTGVLKGVTQKLGAQRAPGKLVVVQGANIGKEFRLAAQVVKVGRDPQFCDVVLYDDYVSNPHFSIHLEQTQFYVTDEGSTNGTRLNGVPIPPHQRMLLQPDAMIEVGLTRLQFKRLGGTTRQLGQMGAQSAPPYQPPSGMPPQPQPPDGTGWPPAQPQQPGGAVWPPAQPQRPGSAWQPPTQPQQPRPGSGGPTGRVP
jgi:Mg-chelatase subunit ChlD